MVGLQVEMWFGLSASKSTIKCIHKQEINILEQPSETSASAKQKFTYFFHQDCKGLMDVFLSTLCPYITVAHIWLN